MTVYRNLLFIAFFAASIIACQDRLNDNKDTFKLTGVVHGTVDTTAHFTIVDSTYSIDIVNDSFHFRLPLSQNEIGIFSSSHGKVQVYAQPNEDLFLHIEKDSIGYNGSLSHFHNEMRTLKEEQFNQDQFSNLRALYSMPIDSFQSLIYTTNKQIKNALDTILDEDNSSWQLRIWESISQDLSMYAMNYPLYHGRLTDNDSFEVNTQYFQEIRDTYRLEDLELLGSRGREDVLKTFVEVQVRIDSPSISSDSIRLKLLIEETEESFEKDTLREVIITQIIKDQLKYRGLGDAESIISNYVSDMPDSKDKDEIKDKMSQWMELSKGNEAPNFTAERIDSTKVSLKDMEGKVVYIDVWATWCGPCLREIPHLEKMYERYADRDDVALVSVSIDSDYEKWVQKVTNDDMGGIQLWMENAWDSKLNEAYMINSIPRFILIDKEGKIVNADAPRPSSGEKIYSMIESAL